MPRKAVTIRNRNRQDARGGCPGWHPGLGFAVAIAFSALVITLSVSPALAVSNRPDGRFTPSALQADPAASERPGDGTAVGDNDATVARTEARRAILYRQGAQTAASLAHVAPVQVVNPYPAPEREDVVVSAPRRDAVSDQALPTDALSAQGVQQVIESRVPGAGAARSAQAVIGTIARAAAATDAPVATAPAAAASAVPRAMPSLPFSHLPVLTLLVVLSGILIIRIWHMRREPFVLKAKAVKVQGAT